MRRLQFALLLAMVAGLLITAPARAATNMQLTIVNHSSYPDSQVYLT
jgi:hypothetical protein